MTRGRLIRPLLVEVERVDTAQSEGAGAYDHVFRTVAPEKMRFRPPVVVRAQVEQSATRAQSPSAAGDVPESRYSFTLHMSELERAGLVLDTGDPDFRPNDRVTKILTLAGAPSKTFTPPLRVIEVQAVGLGLGGRQNLCVLVCEERATGIRG